MTADATFAKRAASRLNALLEQDGFPGDALGRSTAVSERLNIGLQTSQQLLSGLVPWTWAQLDSICSAFGRPPGYFLDPREGPALPADVRVVESVDGGESLVWRTPHGFLSYPPGPDTTLRYCTMRCEGALFPVGSLLVYSEEVLQHDVPRIGGHFMVDRGDGAELMRLRHGYRTVASFEPVHEPGVTVMVPVGPTDRPNENRASTRVVGAVVVAILPA